GACEHIGMSVIRTYSAGSSIEDYCRACKTDRVHTVMAASPSGEPIRVTCGYCGSEHNYRGGPRIDVSDPTPPERPSAAPTRSPVPEKTPVRRDASARSAFPIVSDRERSAPP